MIPCAITADELRARVAIIHDRIESAGGDPGAVALLAVTKGFDSSAVDLAVGAGLTDLGENYAQELVAKADSAPQGVRWHCIGRLQRNKVRLLAPHVSVWQSVDRLELGAEIAKRAPAARVLVQVNVSGEAQKGGCEPGAVAGLVLDLQAEGLAVEGLMAVGATGPPEASRSGFELVRRLADELDLPVRSMGMSNDLDIAIEAGSTMVRVGTGLFGPRSGPAVMGN